MECPEKTRNGNVILHNYSVDDLYLKDMKRPIHCTLLKRSSVIRGQESLIFIVLLQALLVGPLAVPICNSDAGRVWNRSDTNE